MRVPTVGASAVLLLLGAIDPALGADHPFPPLRETVCINGRVDRAKLSNELFEKFRLSQRSTTRRGIAASPPNQKLADMLRMGCSTGCEPADQKALSGIRGNLILFLSGWYEPTFRPQSDGIEPVAYLSGTGEVVCAGAEAGEAPGAEYKPTDKSTSHWRVRGRADQLYIDRSEPGFSTADKALASFDRDAVADTRTIKTLGYAGYYIDLSDDKVRGTRKQVIPFVGIDRNTVEVGESSKAKPSTKNLLFAGAQGTFTYAGGETLATHQFNLMPQYIDDRQAGTRQGLISFEYLPYVRPWANTFNRFIADRYDFAEWKPVVSLKANAGHYFDRGSGADADKLKNYARLGGKIGLAVTSENLHVPLDFEVDYTSMKAISGTPNIDYRTASLTWSFDDNKYSGLTVAYKKGRREDTALKDDDVTVGISIRF